MDVNAQVVYGVVHSTEVWCLGKVGSSRVEVLPRLNSVYARVELVAVFALSVNCELGNDPIHISRHRS